MAVDFDCSVGSCGFDRVDSIVWNFVDVTDVTDVIETDSIVSNVLLRVRLS